MIGSLGMPRHLWLKRGLRLAFVLTGMIGYLLGGWPASAVRSPDPSPSQNIALRFPDLSPSQTIALRFPDVWLPQHGAPAQIVALRFPEPSALGIPLPLNSTPAPALASPKPLLRLMDFQVAATLPPIGHSRFCLRYSDDCRFYSIDFRRRNLVLTPERWNELKIVNRAVNRNIFAEATPGDGVTEEWLISPRAGDCKDYAVTKRHELLARGWPSRALLLSEVTLTSGAHHLVLVVRAKDADLVLDNLSDDIRLVATTYDQYLWVRIQSPENPKFWMLMQRRNAVQTAMLSN